jgi:hypothetical protein
MLKIIDNKRIDITADEYKTYQDICKSYDRPNFQGKDLFSNLFETDDRGVIIFLRPPSSKFVSMEVLSFLQSVMMHQHLRLMYDEIDANNKQIKKLYEDEVSSLRAEISNIKAALEDLAKK